LTNSFVKTIGVKQLSAILNYRRHLQKDDVYHPLGIFSKLTNSFIKIIGVKQLSAILNYRRHLQKNGVYHPLGIFSKVTNSFVKTIGVKQLSAILNYRRHLQKMAYTRSDSSLESTEFFSQILCPLMLRTDPSSS
jgi:hypothetical protein